MTAYHSTIRVYRSTGDGTVTVVYETFVSTSTPTALPLQMSNWGPEPVEIAVPSLAQMRRQRSLAAIAAHVRTARRSRPVSDERPRQTPRFAKRTCSTSTRWMVQR